MPPTGWPRDVCIGSRFRLETVGCVSVTPGRSMVTSCSCSIGSEDRVPGSPDREAWVATRVLRIDGDPLLTSIQVSTSLTRARTKTRPPPAISIGIRAERPAAKRTLAAAAGVGAAVTDAAAASAARIQRAFIAAGSARWSVSLDGNDDAVLEDDRLPDGCVDPPFPARAAVGRL